MCRSSLARGAGGALHPDIAPLADRLRALALEIRQMRVALREAAGRSSGAIVSAQHSLSTLPATWIVDRIADADAPGGLRLHAGDREDCIDMLMRREADIAILYRDGAAAIKAADGIVETVDVSSDVFMPVARSASMLDLPKLPIVSYPDPAFFGRLFAERIAPGIPPSTMFRPRAQTALTLTALRLAEDGVGIAWVPGHLAEAAIAVGSLIDLSGRLPIAPLGIYAMRRRGGASPPAAAAWRALTAKN